MARETRFHPSSNPRGNKRRRRYQMGNPTRSSAGLGSCQESRMAHNAGYWFLSFSVFSPSPFCLSRFFAPLISREIERETLISIGLIKKKKKLFLKSNRGLHTSGLRANWRIRRLRRLVLPLSRLPLRRVRAGEKGSGTAKFGSADI